ncbi:hypothetical protein J2D73_20165 [Acetobacter sacchari]|uniref:Hedgehog/Intein (Hint) domain-containing protein n=1 Tax=Acetobacter sacchari TaxID=2661687 RepID=A0ABS3M1U2_9PROT|nr:hypothetical protein [Acetobacter sacchari]MBO1362095.1 hypothetical protein [Acetobacter sacchari]
MNIRPGVEIRRGVFTDSYVAPDLFTLRPIAGEELRGELIHRGEPVAEIDGPEILSLHQMADYGWLFLTYGGLEEDFPIATMLSEKFSVLDGAPFPALPPIGMPNDIWRSGEAAISARFPVMGEEFQLQVSPKRTGLLRRSTQWIHIRRILA